MASSLARNFGAFLKSQRLLLKLGISRFPFDIKGTIEKGGVLVCNETEYKEFRHHTKDTRPYIKIKEGRAYYDPNRNIYLIIYNNNLTRNRIRFTLAHELAHIALRHLTEILTEIDRGGLPDYEYYRLEGEANTFAGNFLMPPIILKERLKGRPLNPHAIAKSFEVSVRAVREYRIEDYLFWIELDPREVELKLLAQYKLRQQARYCSICNNTFRIAHAKYCFICGATDLLKGEWNKSMFYEKPETTEDGYLKECLKCKNEERIESGEHCIICGSHLVNQCTLSLETPEDQYDQHCNHDKPMPSNARYCPFCGSRTTFLVENLLETWDK